ncbi:potassium-transporting ATPase subunit C [Nocardia africana]|uniref:Potassium-transporting ATPase KdpC subunit n=1 Tax=Nocardia africana TaxID=134964 RepID=A0A378WVN7_9NOCA|nr:potassium-transporting ATPase subunit C [Nocardia africana]MCC3313705.1 potassium-transporting ATPase subunit C [Nocardia africana]SUA44912.1 potassium-transporting ATPase subunit C [Nocardia africana]
MTRLPVWLAQHLAGLRVIALLTLTVGLVYPLAMTGIAQAFGNRAAGSLVQVNGHLSGSSLLGQNFTDAAGNPVPKYFQPRPSAAGTNGYDPTASGAGNLGGESVVDTLPTSSDPKSGSQGLLTQVCARSKAVGDLEGVDGSRPYCTADGVGAVLGAFRANGLTGNVVRVVSLNQACPATPFVQNYEGVTVECATPATDYSAALIIPVRGAAPAVPAVPADAVTASGSGLDPDISVSYAKLQAPRVARERHLPLERVQALVSAHTTGRALGFLGEPAVNVLELNRALDRES